MLVLGSSFQTKVAMAFTAAVLVVAALSFTTWRIAKEATFTATRLAQTNELLYCLARTRAATLQIELATQGFRLSGDPANLIERDAGIADREFALTEIRTLTQNHSEQHVRWDALRKVIDERLAIARHVEELRKNQGVAAANAYVATAPLGKTRAYTYQLLDEMEVVERNRVALQEAEHEDARRTLVVSGILVAATLSGLLLATFFLIRRQLAHAEQAQRALAASEESLAVTVHSIGDALLTTDTAARITRMNPVAEHLTGWSFAEAQGHPVADVFHIVHEHTREPAEIPVQAVLSTGQAQGLANHTVIISREGRETPIADSAAPIYDRSGQINGVVLVFRDVSLEREAERLLEAHNQLLERNVRERTHQLQTTESHLNNIIGAVPALIAFVDANQRYVYVNEQYRKRFAPTQLNITGLTKLEVLGDERYAIARPMIQRALAGEPQSYDWQPFPDVWQAIRYLPKRGNDGAIEGYYVLGTDITERKQAEAKIQRLNSELEQRVHELQRASRALRTLSAGNRAMVRASDEQTLLETMCHAIVTVGGYDLAVVRYRSHRDPVGLETMAEYGFPGGMKGLHDMGLTLDATPLGQGVTSIAIKTGEVQQVRDISTDPHHAPWRDHLAGFNSAVACPLRVGDVVIGALTIYDLEPNPFGDDEIAVLTEFADDLAFGIATLRTRKEQARSQTAINHMLRHDGLTDLPNAIGFAEAISLAIDNPQGPQRWAALLFNVERLGEINDVLGFSHGDQLLRDFGQRLKANRPPRSSVARLRGDEFAILTPAADAAEAMAIAETLERQLASPFPIAGIELSVSSTVGIALYPDHGPQVQDLLRGMSKALYQARDKGLSRGLFRPDQQQDQVERLNMVGELKRAIENEELRVYLQPKVELSTGRVCGAEALIRWQHPRKGLTLPGVFISLAEQTGLIKPLTEWLIVATLNLLQGWQAQGQSLPIAINLSARNFRDEQLFGKFLRWQSERGVQRGLLEVEITESTVMDDAEYALHVLHDLRSLGISLYVDDFGTGYSSLSYLQKLPFDYIKIDQSFVAAMTESRDSAMIVRSTIDLVHDLRRKTVAEGVETAAHWNLLKDLGCDIAQGYYIARPMPAEEFLNWVATFQASRLG
jgi:diguanylate cyclase (GGDEF)-like protein/PAS domain S-box-containing protein